MQLQAKATGSRQKLEEAKKESPPRALGGGMAQLTLDFGLLASRTVTE